MMDTKALEELIAKGECLGIEFKSDKRQISDSEIYEDVVAMANTDGGVILIGVEDNRMVTGAKVRHGETIDPYKIRAAIFNNTRPPINTRVSVVVVQGEKVITIEVDKVPEICATASGKCVKRVIGSDGKPQNIPFYPQEHLSRRINLGLLDFSSQLIETAEFKDLDPLEIERLRRMVKILGGEQSLLSLSDQEFVKALRLVESHKEKLVPNIAGLLVLGKKEIIEKLLPTHAVHFQIIDEKGDIRVNEVFKDPVVRVIEEIESRFKARNQEQEIIIGMFRFPVPDYSKEGFREAVNNAILHRDYSHLGAVYIQWYTDYILITNPGGFPEGITIDNILVHEPKPRNPRLAEVFRRIGLIEQTGRGVDKIFMGQLRYGRPAPDYSGTNQDGVKVVLRGGRPSLNFVAFVYEQEKQGSLTLDEIMILNQLFFERRIDSDLAGKLIQKGTQQARAILEKLNERGLIEAKGEKKGRVYTLSSHIYQQFGDEKGYVHSRGISLIKHEEMVIDLLKVKKRIKRADVMELCGLSGDQAAYLLKKMVRKGLIVPIGNPPRWVQYEIKARKSNG